MQLRYTTDSGKQAEFVLDKEVAIIGRAQDADLVLENERASRHHAEIRLWGGDYVLKDLRSRNGTYVNGERVDVVQLSEGDRIQIGGIDLHFGDPSPKAPNTVLRRIGAEMEEGRGYRTMLKSIVDEATESEDTHKSASHQDVERGGEV